MFLCDCLLQLDEVKQAQQILSEVKPEELSNTERLDYVFALAGLAMETAEPERLENAKAALRSATVRDPYFRERRDSLLLSAQEALVSES